MHDTLKNIFQTLSENAEENFVKHKNANDYLVVLSISLDTFYTNKNYATRKI